MRRGTHLGIAIGTLAGAALLVRVSHAGGWEAVLTVLFIVLLAVTGNLDLH